MGIPAPKWQEWAAFNQVWEALEAAHGRPPDRDFCAWKADPRAWVKAADCPGSDCRVDHEKVSIECAMGLIGICRLCHLDG